MTGAVESECTAAGRLLLRPVSGSGEATPLIIESERGYGVHGICHAHAVFGGGKTEADAKVAAPFDYSGLFLFSGFAREVDFVSNDEHRKVIRLAFNSLQELSPPQFDLFESSNVGRVVDENGGVGTAIEGISEGAVVESLLASGVPDNHAYDGVLVEGDNFRGKVGAHGRLSRFAKLVVDEFVQQRGLPDVAGAKDDALEQRGLLRRPVHTCPG